MDNDVTIRAVRNYPTATVEVCGLLRVENAIILRNAFRRHLVDQPAALIIDFTEVRIAARDVLTMLQSALRGAAAVPAIPLVLFVPDPGLHELMRSEGFGEQAPLVSDRVVAEAYAARHPLPHHHALRGLPPHPSVLRLVRRVARDACLDWGVPQHSGTVELVVGELATNAIEHARTRCDVTIARRGHQVHVAVRDGSPFPPRRQGPGGPASVGGRGLLVVDGLATGWGSVPVDEGKLVWAAIAVDRSVGVDDGAEMRRLSN